MLPVNANSYQAFLLSGTAGSNGTSYVRLASFNPSSFSGTLGFACFSMYVENTASIYVTGYGADGTNKLFKGSGSFFTAIDSFPFVYSDDLSSSFSTSGSIAVFGDRDNPGKVYDLIHSYNNIDFTASQVVSLRALNPTTNQFGIIDSFRSLSFPVENFARVVVQNGTNRYQSSKKFYVLSVNTYKSIPPPFSSTYYTTSSLYIYDTYDAVNFYPAAIKSQNDNIFNSNTSLNLKNSYSIKNNSELNEFDNQFFDSSKNNEALTDGFTKTVKVKTIFRNYAETEVFSSGSTSGSCIVTGITKDTRNNHLYACGYIRMSANLDRDFNVGLSGSRICC